MRGSAQLVNLECAFCGTPVPEDGSVEDHGWHVTDSMTVCLDCLMASRNRHIQVREAYDAPGRAADGA